MSFKNIIKNRINLRKDQKFVSIIGLNPSKGARSPLLWNKAFFKLKMKTKMFPLDVNNKNLGTIVNFLKLNNNFLASSITLPYKEKIIKYLDEVDQTAQEIGSVNLIVKEKNRLKGYNTDSLGFLYSLNKIKKKIKNILIIGCGGAGKSCIISTKNRFPTANIFLFNRDLNKLKKFYKRIKTNKKNIKIVKNFIFLNKLKKLDLIVNTTSIGFDLLLPPNNLNLKYFSPISQSEIKFNNLDSSEKAINKIIDNLLETFVFLKANSKAYIFDIIYNPLQTTIMKIGENVGMKTINGLEMNFMQAVEAFKIVNKKIDRKKIIRAMK
tara:strand:+ start:4094 stop:5065 length:972 start_codon:yes stop_codon:yes gene_type:complete